LCAWFSLQVLSETLHSRNNSSRDHTYMLIICTVPSSPAMCKLGLNFLNGLKVLSYRASRYISIWNQSDALSIQFTENEGPLHVSSIACSSSGAATQTAFSLLCAYNVHWLWHGCSETGTLPQPHNIPNAICVAPPEDEHVMFKTCTGPWFSINWKDSAPCWFHCTALLTDFQQIFKLDVHVTVHCKLGKVVNQQMQHRRSFIVLILTCLGHQYGYHKEYSIIYI
jgi:hypothetical protein